MYFSPFRRTPWPSAIEPFWPVSSSEMLYASYTSSSTSVPSFFVTVALYGSEKAQNL